VTWFLTWRRIWSSSRSSACIDILLRLLNDLPSEQFRAWEITDPAPDFFIDPAIDLVPDLIHDLILELVHDPAPYLVSDLVTDSVPGLIFNLHRYPPLLGRWWSS
jgi:hypothetical protein